MAYLQWSGSSADLALTVTHPELVDALTAHGAQAKEDALQLYRRVVFNVLVFNVDDHLRNHGFLWTGQGVDPFACL
jgi:serine/threonine protein kinase HipA of HipAB toxin-antitoxin module